MSSASMQTATALRAVDVVKSYGKGETAVTALAGVSFTVPAASSSR